MTVAFKSKVTSSNVNNAFASKTADNNLSGKQTLSRSGSGPTVNDVQKRLNDSIFITYATEEIASSGEITNATNEVRQYRRVKGLGGAQTASITPFGSAGGWQDGAIFRLIGVSDAESLTIQNNDNPKGFILNGDIELSKYVVLEVQYDLVLDRFLEIGRNV